MANDRKQPSHTSFCMGWSIDREGKLPAKRNLGLGFADSLGISSDSLSLAAVRISHCSHALDGSCCEPSIVVVRMARLVQ